MIHFVKTDGTSGTIINDENCTIEKHAHSFTIIKRVYGYDEYDFWYDNIEDVCELKIS